MSNECPQCKAKQPRAENRFCNQCGAELRQSEMSDKAKENTPNNVEPEENFSTESIEAGEGASDSSKAVVRIVQRDGVVVEREVVNGETKIGKGPANDIILADPSVSTSHALITGKDGSFTLTDLGSRNGTLINEERLNGTKQLSEGDRIKMGRCLLTFRVGLHSETMVMAPPQAVVAQVLSQEPVTEDQLAAAVVAEGIVDESKMKEIRGPSAKGRRLFRVLIEDHDITDLKLRDLMSVRLGIPIAELSGLGIDQPVAKALTPRFLRENLLFPVVASADHLALVVADPTDKARIESVKEAAKRPVQVRLAAATQIAAKLDQNYAPRLIGVLPTGDKVEALLTQNEMEIGKAAHNQIVLAHPTVSNTHAVIMARNGGYSIVDLGSSNGTFVNGQRLDADAKTLQHGDKVQIAEVALTFRNPGETNESKTARLSPELLDEIRRRANLGLPISNPPAKKAKSTGELSGDDQDKSDKKKKKKKDDDRLKAALVNSMSRLVATVVGSILTVVGTIYLLRSPLGGGGGSVKDGGGVSQSRSKLSSPSPFTTYTGGSFETSGVTWIEDTNSVLLVDDSRPTEVLLMSLDQNGKQTGAITAIPHGADVVDPEAITEDGTWFYVVGSQADPKEGPRNAIVRFAFDRQSKTIRANPDVIHDLRSFLLQIPEISAEGQKPGSKGGLNIEGLAWDPPNNRLLVGLRSPLIDGHAVIIPLKLKDPQGSFSTSNLQLASPRVIKLNLEGQGVRDIDYNKHLKTFLIVSGATELTEKTDFGLWEWNGDAEQTRIDSRPRHEKTLDERAKPEGVTNVTLSGKSFVLLACDLSGYFKLDYVDGR
jgi:pSer/pThr/pTyr-binding forkhead associated (FHA) protein